MADETLTICVVPYRHGWCLAAFNRFRRWYCGRVLLGTVVGSNCIRALSGNENARHPENWPSRNDWTAMAIIMCGASDSGEYGAVR